MEAARAALPELQRGRHEPVTSPGRRQRHGLPLVSERQVADARFEIRAVGQHLALARGERPDAARERAAAEIALRLLAADALDDAADADLALEVGPVEYQRRPRVLGQLPALLALVVLV